MMFFLLACGFDGPIDAPSPPPMPPPALASRAADVLAVTGTVGDIAIATRSWTLAAESRRYICVLTDQGVLEVAGRVTQVADLPPGATVAIEAKVLGDLLLVSHASVKPAAPDADLGGTTPAPAPTGPAAAAEGAVPAGGVTPSAEAAAPTPTPPGP